MAYPRHLVYYFRSGTTQIEIETGWYLDLNKCGSFNYVHFSTEDERHVLLFCPVIIE